MKKIGLLFAVILLLVPGLARAALDAKPPLTFEQLSVEKGLSQGTVFSICQDKRGFIWFGTEDGLNKYDGYGFVIYRNDPDDPHSISDGYIDCIYEDSSGVLWIGTVSGGLNRYDRQKDRFLRYPLAAYEPNGLRHQHVTTLYEDRLGALWIGTRGGGLSRLNRKTGQFTHYQNNPENPHSLSYDRIGAIIEDREGILWVGTYGGGLDKFDPETGRFTHFKHDPQRSDSISGDRIWSMYETTSGHLLVGTSGSGLNLLNRETGTFTRYQYAPHTPRCISNNYVSSIFEDTAGVLWVGTWGGGLNRFDLATGTFSAYRYDRFNPNSLCHDGVLCLYEDRSGILWSGTWGGGAGKLDRKRKKFNVFRNIPEDAYSLSNNSVWSIIEDRGGTYWIGTENGLNRFNRKSGRFYSYFAPENDPLRQKHNDVRFVLQSRSGTIWLGTFHGLGILDRTTGKLDFFHSSPEPFPHQLCNDEITALYEDRKGILWVGTKSGLLRYNSRTKHFKHYIKERNNPESLMDNNILSIFEDRADRLWLGTPTGLCRFDREGDRFIRHISKSGSPDSILKDKIHTIFEDRQGLLWLGTMGGGLGRFDPTAGTFTYYTTKNGLPNNMIYGILEDEKGNLWLSTNNGLSRFTPQTGTFRNYDVSDGLQCNEYNAGAYFKNKKGEMFFGGINGFNAFFPDAVKDDPNIPPIVLTAFKKFNRDFKTPVHVSEMEELALSHKDTVISFEFSALNYTDTHKSCYAYKLEGFHDHWIQLGHKRDITLTNLEPRDYIFRVKGANHDGVWNETGTSLRITVSGPFWKNWLFRGFGLLLLAFAGIAYYRRRIANMTRQQKKLETQVEDRTQEIRLKTKELTAANQYLAQLIEKQKEAEAALEESEKNYRNVVERASDGIVILQDENVAYLNPQLARMLGYPPEQLLGEPFQDYLCPQNREKLLQYYHKRLADEIETERYEACLIARDNRKIDVELGVGKTLFREKPALLIFLRDVTRRKELERELLKAGKLESIGMMAGGIAHDFNNLLSVVLGNLNLARMSLNSGKKIDHFLTRTEKAAIIATNLANRFITFSEGEEPIKQVINIGDIIKDAADVELLDAPVEFNIHIHENLHPVNCEGEQVYQVFSNLFSNAKEAVAGIKTENETKQDKRDKQDKQDNDDKEKAKLITVKAENRVLKTREVAVLRGGKYVYITVEDTGKGISEENLTRIFDPYFTTKSNVTDKGLGLGLAIVHSIIKKHNGYIDVTSEVGKGSTFHLYLPAASV